MMNLRWDALAVLAARSEATGNAASYDMLLQGPLADLIDHVLTLPVAAQKQFVILAEDLSDPIDIVRIHQLRCRPDYPG